MEPMKRAREALRAVKAGEGIVTVLTGAGISAESGVPTFRGAGGLWREHRAQDLATPEAFAKDPQLVWDFYEMRRELVQPLEPNPGHRALAALEQQLGDRMRIFTQNIDGLHQAAGSQHVEELHGSLWRLRGMDSGRVFDDRTIPLPRSGDPLVPRCQESGEMLRPHVVWFGEPLDSELLHRAQLWTEGCEVFLIVGTSSNVYPAAGLAPLAANAGATVIEVNPDPAASGVTFTLAGPSGELLPKLCE